MASAYADPDFIMDRERKAATAAAAEEEEEEENGIRCGDGRAADRGAGVRAGGWAGGVGSGRAEEEKTDNAAAAPLLIARR